MSSDDSVSGVVRVRDRVRGTTGKRPDLAGGTIAKRDRADRGPDRPVVLLTGFGPFPGVPRNASAELVTDLAAVCPNRFPGFAFASAVLPVDWREAPHRLAEILRETAPAVALHFGVSSRATGFVIERHAYNETSDTVDVDGRTSGAVRLVAGDRDRRSATLPARTIVRTLERRGYPVVLSEDPGRYLCNAVLYHSLKHATAAAPRRRTGFVHIPAALDNSVAGAASRLDWNAALTGSLHLMETCLDLLRRRDTVLS